MTTEELVAKVKNLTPVSQAALRLVAMLDHPALSNDEVVEVLKYDTVLTAKLLRACNSPYFGFEDPVSSVEQAVLILGHQQILHLVLSLAFSGAMNTPLPGYAAESGELWRHSLTTAMAAETFTKSWPALNIEPPVAFTAGLLHDIGKLVFNHVLDDATQTAIRRRIQDGALTRTEAEKEILGADHGEVGAHLLRSWKLPEDIVEAVANHHLPICEPTLRLSAVTHVANCLAHLVGSTLGWEGYAVRADVRVTGKLELTPEKLEDLMIAVHESASKVEHFAAMS
jgi:putative nucleotidyltransferase with HDIG domain